MDSDQEDLENDCYDEQELDLETDHEGDSDAGMLPFSFFYYYIVYLLIMLTCTGVILY